MMEHCSAKKVLKISPFYLKSTMYLLLWNIDGIKWFCKSLKSKTWSIPFFFTYKVFIETVFVKNKIFYMTVHPGRVSIVTNNYFVRNKIWHNVCDCILKSGHLLVTSKSMSADCQSNKSTALFIWSEFASEKCHKILS